MAFFYTFTKWDWLIFAALLLILEISMGAGGVLFWLGLSALMVSFIVWTLSVMSWLTQIMLFSGLGILTVVSWKIYLKRHPGKTDQPKLNQRKEQYIDRTFTLYAPIQNGRGKIMIDGVVWTVSGPDLPINTMIKIIQTDGAILLVEKVI